MKNKISTLLIVLSCFVHFSCSSKTVKGPSSSDIVYPVSVEVVSEQELPDALELKGNFSPFDKVDVVSETEGRIVSLAVLEGQNVILGDPLIVVQADVLKMTRDKLKAELRELEAKKEAGLPIQNIQTEKTHVEKNMKEESTSPGNFESNSNTLNVNPFSVKNSNLNNPNEFNSGENQAGNSKGNGTTGSENEMLPEENLTKNNGIDSKNEGGVLNPEKLMQAYEASIERVKLEINLVEKKLESATIQVPLTGIISKKNVSEGSVVKVGEILFQIVRADPIVLTVYVPADHISEVSQGKKMEVAVEGVVGQSFHGEVASVGVEPDLQNKNYPVKIAISNSDLKIKAGMSAKAFIPLGKMRSSILVPKKAVFERDGKTFVYLLTSSNVAELKEVETGQVLGDKIEVKKSISAKDKVIVKGFETMKEKQEYIKLDEATSLN